MKARIYIAPQVLYTEGSLSWIRSALNDYINVHAGHYFTEIDHPYRRVSVCNVVAGDAEHAAILSGANIVALSPLVDDPKDLQAALQSLLSAEDSAKMEAHGTDMQWADGSTKLLDGMRRKLRLFSVAQRINGRSLNGAFEFLTANLDATVGSFTAAQRNRITNILTNIGVSTSGITLTTKIRQILRSVATSISLPSIKLGNLIFS